MPSIRSLVFKRRAYTVAVIFSFGKIIPSYSRCKEKKLVYVVIMAPFGRQPFFYIKYTKSNICLSCNIKLVSDAKCIFTFLCNIYSLS